LIVYLDTSSLLKIFVNEPGSPEVAELVARSERVATSLVTYAEGRAALARARRGSRLTDPEFATALAAFEGEWPTYSVQGVSHVLVREAGELADRHFLTVIDAIHLASAIVIQRAAREPVTFSAADSRLVDAAEAEGLTPARLTP